MEFASTRVIQVAVIACGVFLTVSPGGAQTGATGGSTGTSDPASASAGRVADGFSWFADAETRFSSWKGTRGANVFEPVPGKGSQFYTPATLGIDYQQPGAYRIQTRVKGGYVHSSHRTAGQEATIDTLVDTQVTTTFTHLAAQSYRTFIGVALNLPTGTTYLPGLTRLTRMDPDLVDVGSYGAGFNVNPTAGLIFALTENTAVSISAGWAWQGEFTRESLELASRITCGTAAFCNPQLLNPQFNTRSRIDPGDVFTANLNTSTIYNNLAFKTSLAYMSETNVRQDGLAIGRKGAKYIANAEMRYRFDPRWTLVLNGSWAFTEKNKVVDPAGVLVTELKNSNSNVLIGSGDILHAINERLIAGVNYSILWRDQNFYDIIEEQFVPSKIKHSVGGALTYLTSEKSSVTLRGSHFWVKEDDGAFRPILARIDGAAVTPITQGFVPPKASFTGWTGVITGKILF